MHLVLFFYFLSCLRVHVATYARIASSIPPAAGETKHAAGHTKGE